MWYVCVCVLCSLSASVGADLRRHFLVGKICVEEVVEEKKEGRNENVIRVHKNTKTMIEKYRKKLEKCCSTKTPPVL